MIDLISLVVTLIIMSLFVIGLMMMLIIMSQPKSKLEQEYEDEAQIQYIKEYNFKKQQKKIKRKEFINKIISKIKMFFTRR